MFNTFAYSNWDTDFLQPWKMLAALSFLLLFMFKYIYILLHFALRKYAVNKKESILF